MNKLIIAALVSVGTLGLGACASGYRHSDAYASTSDGAIQTSIKATITHDERLADSRIQVTSMNGQVNLSGFARSEDDKARAGQIARNASGVTDVRNDIEVRPATGN